MASLGLGAAIEDEQARPPREPQVDLVLPNVEGVGEGVATLSGGNLYLHLLDTGLF